MDERPLDRSALESLLKFDEALRNAGTQGISSGTSPGFDHETATACQLLARLEAEIPRQSELKARWVPTRIGRFEIEAVLGTGGFSIVYAAMDHSLNRRVAIKIPRPMSLPDPGLRQRFLNEARAAAKLDHPNIVQVFETGGDGEITYIAMALCEGPDLECWLNSRNNPPSPKLAAMIVRELAKAVHYSHCSGIIHRDIKPGNVLLFPDPTNGIEEFPYQPRLADFGLAKLLAAGGTDSLSITMLGTPRYMAPEVIRNSTTAATAQSDVYAMGAVLYTLLTGRPPFSSASTAETLRQIVDTDPVSPQTIDPSIPRDLCSVCLRCLEKLPEHRYASALDLVDELDRFLSGRPVHAKPTRTIGRLVKWSKRQPLLATSLGALTAGLLGFAVFWGQYTRALSRLDQELTTRNGQLSLKVKELDAAVASETHSREDSERHLQMADELNFVQDLNLASDLMRNGDPAAASRLLAIHNQPPDGETEPSFDRSRYFAYRYLKARTSLEPVKSGHSGQAVWSMVSSPVSEEFAVCGAAGRVQIFSSITLNLLREQQIADTELNTILWQQDGRTIVAGGDDGKLYFCDAATLSVQRQFPVMSPEAIYCLAAAQEPNQLVMCGRRPRLVICSTETGQVLQEIATPHEGDIETFAVAADRSFLISGGDDGRICRYEMPDFKLAWQFRISDIPGTTVGMIQFNRDHQTLTATGRPGELWILDANQGSVLHSWKCLDRIYAAVAGLDYVICGDASGVLSNLRIDGAPELSPIQRWQKHDARISSILPLPNSNPSGNSVAFVSADRNGLMHRWDVNMESRTVPIQSPQTPSRTTANSTGWNTAGDIVRTSQSGIQVFNRQNQIEGHSLKEYPLCAVACLTENDCIAGTLDGRIVLSLDGRIDVVQAFPDVAVFEISADAEGRFATARSVADEAILLDVGQRKILFRGELRAAQTISRDGRWFVSARQTTDDLEVYDLSDVTNLAPVRIIAAHRSTISDLAFTPDGRRLISASNDRTLAVWKTDSWLLEHRIPAQPIKDGQLAVHPDNRTVATFDETMHVRLFDVVAGRETVSLPERFEKIRDVSFAPDGRSLAVSLSDQTVTIINVP